MNQLKTGWLSMLAQEFDNILDAIQAIILSFLVKLGPFCVALMPALFTAYAIYHTFQAEAGRDLALLFAVVVGLALETVGIVATHTAIDLYNGAQARVIQAGKFWLMLALVPVYVVGVFLTVYFSGDAFRPLVKSLGMASPFLTVIVYIAVALARDLSNIKLGQSQQSQHNLALEQDDHQHKQRLELEELRLNQSRLLEQDKLQAQVQIERARLRAQQPLEQKPSQLEQELLATLSNLSQHKKEPEPAELAQNAIVCPDCGRNGFSTVQALNAHKRFCVGVPVNGKGVH